VPLIALTTFAVLRAAPGDARVQGFFDRLPDTFGTADRFEGFVARSMRDPVTLEHSWGAPVPPRFFDPAVHAGTVFTLSLWRTLESVNAFAYSGVHGEALRHRLEWFVKPEWPSYAAWWVADDHIPDWHEANERLEHLHDNGPSPHAFDFRVAFGPGHEPATIDRKAVRELAGRAAAGPQDGDARRSEAAAILRALKAGFDTAR
jgi:hypothetical protein